MRLVVSLTTLPERAALLRRAIDSLRRQSRPPDAIYLWCPAERFGSRLACPRFDGVSVRLTPDLGPATKLLPTLDLETAGDTRLIVADDDVEYPPDLIAKLAAASELFPERAIGFTGWSLEGPSAAPLVRHWNEEEPAAGMYQPVTVLEGYRGIIYRRAFFGPDLSAHAAAHPAFRCHDDILFSGYLASRGIARVARWYGVLPTPADRLWGLHGQDIGLHRRADWLALGRAALDYWSRSRPDWLAPVAGPPTAARLQWAASAEARAGFSRRGAASADQADAVLSSPRPPGGFAELLLLDPAPHPARWLSRCRAVLRADGLLMIGLAAAVPVSASSGSPPVAGSLASWRRAAAVEWRAVWEAAGERWLGTLLPARRGPPQRALAAGRDREC